MSRRRPRLHGVDRDRVLARRWFMQAKQLHEQGNLEAALPLYKKSLKAEPGNVPSLYGAAMLMWQLGDTEVARRWMLQVVARAPQMADAHYNLAVIHETRGEWLSAFAEFEEAIRLRPSFGDAWEGFGKCLHAFGNPADAIVCFEKALEVRPPPGTLTAESRYNMSYSLLALGRWREGWEAYEARFQSPVFMGGYIIRHHEPSWDGSPLEGRKLLVHAEQGFGDSIMMSRYIPLIEGDVHVEVQAPLVPLFAESFPKVSVSAQGEEPPRCDCQVAMMSLPHRFNMSAENVPSEPWLWPSRGCRLYQEPPPMLPPGDGLKVGFVWAGSASHRSDKRRSIPLEFWKPLFAVPGVTWYSMQLDEQPVGFYCHNLKPLIKDFADTAALIAQLDLVICCDTSVAHLAGALGKPVWVLLPTVPDYRWGMHESVTPWYPTMRLVRQQTSGDWAGVMAEVAEGLRALADLRPQILEAQL